jgi:hypothetical protein
MLMYIQTDRHQSQHVFPTDILLILTNFETRDEKVFDEFDLEIFFLGLATKKIAKVDIND